MMQRFSKCQGLGNDYIVLARDDLAGLGAAESGCVVPGLPIALVRRICDRHFGAGSDGILVEEDVPSVGAPSAGGAAPPEPTRFALHIINPDGSEAEKSGNGLRIFARSLWDDGRVGEVTVEMPGGTLAIGVDEDYAMTMLGPVGEVMRGTIAADVVGVAPDT